MDAATRQRVRDRARDRCEYCRLLQSHAPFPLFHIEHIRARKHGGTDGHENLCLACNHCNSHKGPNLTGIDPLTDEVTRIFDPRKDDWHEHFAFEGAKIAGRTAVGRATVTVLNMNSEDRLELRIALIESGLLHD